MSDVGGRLGSLVVARWYPADDDPGRGGFVADQVEALRATGRIAPAVLSFEDVRLSGATGEQAAMSDAIAAFDALGRSIGGGWASAGANAPVGIPVRRARVAHLSASVRRPGDDGTTHAAAASAVEPAPMPVDVIHAHGGYPDGIAGAAVAAMLGRPYVITEHASYVHELLADPIVRDAYLRVALGAARVIAVSRTLADRLGAAAPELAGRLTIVPNAIAVDRLRLADPTGRRADELLYIGGRRASKGTGLLLEAFARVRSARPSMTLRLIGAAPGGDEPWLTLADTLGIRAAVTFEEPLDRAGVAAALARATLFVHPSPAETFGVVAAEALATGLPVVAADSGGVTEIMQPDPDRFGAIVPRDDAAALAAGIERTLDRLDAFERSALRERIVERYAAATVADRLASLLEAVVAEAGGIAGGIAGAPPGRPAAPDDGPRPAAAGARRSVIVVGLDRPRLAARLAKMPPEVRRTVSVMTVAGEAPLPADLAAVHEPAIDDDVRLEVARLRRSRIRRLRYRIEDRDEDAPKARRRAVRVRVATTALVELAALAGDQRPLIVPVDGPDHLVALGAVRAGAGDASPAGLRWLADLAASRPT